MAEHPTHERGVDREYAVEVRVRESFTVRVFARNAKDAEQKARAGEYEDASQSHGDRKWTSVRARRADA